MGSRYETKLFAGPRPFPPVDEAPHSGREREVYQATSWVLAKRVLLVHSRAGAGMTSFLTSGLMRRLEFQEDCDVLPVGRVRQLHGYQPPDDVDNVYVFNLLSNWAAAAPRVSEEGLEYLANLTLPEFLRRRQSLAPVGWLSAPRVLVVDQLEELFTVAPHRWSDREGFFRQLGEALEDDDLLRVVLGISEEHLAELESYHDLIPGRLRARMRLDPAVPHAVAAIG